ncbi:hypothetical protein VM1G_10049 [Cytospora mali]|uniref:Uncharacterized protein n=1 Tax=Cytospora mali TaxID=578113 RepID=A0A194WDF7_CYTMA|nr:hypothetical protein VM1G_10049 [Valsa mali]
MLELWLGVIVSCIPTLGTILNNYGKPAITSMARIFGISGDETLNIGSNGLRGLQLVTIGGTGRVQKFHAAAQNYTELDDSYETTNAIDEQNDRHEDMSAVISTPGINNKC